MRTSLVTPPAVEPVTLAEAKTHLGIVDAFTLHDAMIGELIEAARQACEPITRSAFITQTWDLFLDHWPHPITTLGRPSYQGSLATPYWGSREPIYLPRAPLRSVDLVEYYDQGGTLQTLDPTAYLWTASNQPTTPGRIMPAPLTAWPFHQVGRPDAIKVRFTCGHGDDGSAVPACVKLAIKILTMLYYEGRETPGDVPDGVVNLLAPASAESYT